MYRQTLYDHCLKHVPGTHKASLVSRKNTGHKAGGTFVHVKLAEDIYKLLHYIQGDQTQDISRLFPDKIKLQIRNERIFRSHNQTNMASRESSTPLSSFQDTSHTNLVQCYWLLSGFPHWHDNITIGVAHLSSIFYLIVNIVIYIYILVLLCWF